MYLINSDVLLRIRRDEFPAGHANRYDSFFIRIATLAFIAHAEAIVICFYIRSQIAM